MSKVALNPYIFFKGDCEEAMKFYKEIFGGELELMKYEDVPGDFPGKAEMKGKMMNSSLMGGLVDLRGSDTQKASPESKKVDLCLTGSDESQLRKIFEGLSAGGNVTTPLEKMFWGDLFGTVTDKFGVYWMVDITA